MKPFPEKSSQKLRVCAYARVSTDKDDQANSYESQVNYFTEYIKRHNEWEFLGVYADGGASGTSTAKRASFNRMISDAHDGLIDLILTKEVSRFARNTVDTLSITRTLKKLGVYVIFLNDNINTSDNDGELRLSIMATIAQDESRKTSERVKWGQRRRMERGVVFGRDMLGYSVHGGKLYLNEEEAEIVKLIFHKFTIEGKGTHIIARELREAGIHPKRVKEWSNTVILRLLRNEKYVGDLCQKKTYTPDYLDHAKKYNRGEEEKIYIKDHHPEIAIISRQLWNRTQEELSRRAPSPERSSRHSNRYWCSGKLECGECGGTFVSRTKSLKSGEVYKSWRCFKAARNGRLKTDVSGNTVGCNGRQIGDRTLRTLTAYAASLIDIDRELIKKRVTGMVMPVLNSPGKRVNKKKLQTEIESIKKKKLKSMDLAAEGAISVADMKELGELYNERIAELEKALSEADIEEAGQSKKGNQQERYTARIDELLSPGSTDGRLLHELLERAVIYKDSYADIYLGCVPFGIRIYYETSGKLDKFRVSIVSTNPIRRP